MNKVKWIVVFIVFGLLYWWLGSFHIACPVQGFFSLFLLKTLPAFFTVSVVLFSIFFLLSIFINKPFCYICPAGLLFKFISFLGKQFKIQINLKKVFSNKLLRFLFKNAWIIGLLFLFLLIGITAKFGFAACRLVCPFALLKIIFEGYKFKVLAIIVFTLIFVLAAIFSYRLFCVYNLCFFGSLQRLIFKTFNKK